MHSANHTHCDEFARSRATAGAGLPMIEPGMPAPAGTGLSRRSLMLRSLGLGMAVYGAGALSAAERVEAAINDALGSHKVIVNVFAAGGWDSLSVLVPFGSDHRHEARLNALRPTLSGAIARSDQNIFADDPSLSWHPSASGLRDLWTDPSVGVAVAPAIGYAGPNYSHFTSRHFWETGAVDLAGGTGWMGRYLDQVGSSDVPIQGVTLGDVLAPSMATAKVPVSAIYDIDKFNYAFNAENNGTVVPAIASAGFAELRALAGNATGDAPLDQSRLTTTAAFQLLDTTTQATKTPQPTVPYPTVSSHFIDSLKDTARLLDTKISGASLPVRCVSLTAHGAYDTHDNQTQALSSNLQVTTQGVKAFWSDLQARGLDDRVVVLLWSEFGRRPNENGSGGSDHGAGGTAFVIGKSVKQGLIGEFPGLGAYGSAGAGLMQDGNLRATSDFRGLYSALLEQWFDADASGLIAGAGNRPGAGAFARPQLF